MNVAVIQLDDYEVGILYGLFNLIKIRKLDKSTSIMIGRKYGQIYITYHYNTGHNCTRTSSFLFKVFKLLTKYFPCR